MPRAGLRICAAVVVMLGAGALVVAGDDRDRIRDTLAVHVALEQGLEQLQRGRFAEAVAILEKQIAFIDGNRRYLLVLRDAYRGYIEQLKAENRLAELKRYQGRLAILEPAGRAQPPAPLARQETQPAAPTPTRQARGNDRPPIKARGVPGKEKPAPDDPFAEANRASRSEKECNLVGGRPDEAKARRLVEEAEKAFEHNQYEAAAEMFKVAELAWPGSVAGCKERWGYCRLCAAAQVVNRGPIDRLSSLEDEVKAALGQAPKLEAFANRILKDLREVSWARVPVKHTPRQGNGWAVAESANFRIYHATSEQKVEAIARLAEATRVVMTRKWFGEAPATWSPACVIYLHPTAQGYSKATGAPVDAPGHSRLKQEGERILERRIDLPADNPSLSFVLTQETTHMVLAGRFGAHCVPRWADVGMAVLSQPQPCVNDLLRNLPAHQRDGALFSIRELMGYNDWPEPRRVGPFYAQTVSVVDFLCKKKDPATFAKFLREGLQGGTERALERYYGYRSFAELENDWKQHALGAAAVANLSQKPR
jgi:hypothetical protein